MSLLNQSTLDRRLLITIYTTTPLRQSVEVKLQILMLAGVTTMRSETM